MLLRVPPGEIFGEAALLAKPAEYLVSSEAIINTTTLVWSRRTIRGLCERYPRLVENALLISFDYLAGYRAVHASSDHAILPRSGSLESWVISPPESARRFQEVWNSTSGMRSLLTKQTFLHSLQAAC